MNKDGILTLGKSALLVAAIQVVTGCVAKSTDSSSSADVSTNSSAQTMSSNGNTTSTPNNSSTATSIPSNSSAANSSITTSSTAASTPGTSSTGGNNSTATSSTAGNNSSAATSTNQSSTDASSANTTSSQGTQSSTGAMSSSGSQSSSPIYTSGTDGIFRVNSDGQITKSGQVMPVRCGNWFGLEGQHEESGAAPMELYIGNMWWDNTGRTIDQDLAEIKRMGINTVRLPIAPQTLVQNHPDGQGFKDFNAPGDARGSNLKNTYTSYSYPDAYSAMIGYLDKAEAAGVNVMIDIHSCSNYVGWRAGRLDSAPPYVDANRGADYKFTRENFSCGPQTDGVTSHEYNEQKWLADIKTISELSQNYTNVIGIDIFNEPWDYSWDQWATLAEKAYKVIEENNDDLLIFVQGISGGNHVNEVEPHGSSDTNPNWGENFYGFNDRPLDIPQDRLVISPHTYGPAVYQQAQFMDIANQPECEGLHGDEASEHKCKMVMERPRLEPGWEEHFGFLRDMGYAVVIGEFGGNRYWPTGGGARQSEADAWAHLTPTNDANNIDLQWQQTFTRYMKDHDIQGCYWGINPESADTGGLYEHKYTSDGKSWGYWTEVDFVKLNLLRDLWTLPLQSKGDIIK